MTNSHNFIANTLTSSQFLNCEYIMTVTQSLSTVPPVTKITNIGHIQHLLVKELLRLSADQDLFCT